MPTFTLRPPTPEEIIRDLPVPADLVLDAEVIKIEERVLPFTDKNGGELTNLEFTFRISDDTYGGKTLRGEVRPEFKMTEYCPLRDWVQELLQTELQEGFALDTDMLIGKRCRVNTFIRTWDKSDGTKGQMTIVNNVFRSTDAAPTQLPSNQQTATNFEPF